LEFISTYHTDVGIKKSCNQDSLFLAEAQTAKGQVLLAVVCDGMGGLAQGEVVSATLIKAFQRWFREELPLLIAKGYTPDGVKLSWEALIRNCNERVAHYSAANHVSLGTTVVALLLIEGQYFITTVGDSRVYEFTNALYQLTVDQTVVQREVELGLLTPEQAEQDSRRNVLLQCVGACAVVQPAFTSGAVTQQVLFMLCSDGFRHKITPAELWETLNPQVIGSEQQLHNNLVYLIDTNKYRREEDNISAIAVKVM
jgi:serine/threonine protein phosphatase PrpC